MNKNKIKRIISGKFIEVKTVRQRTDLTNLLQELGYKVKLKEENNSFRHLIYVKVNEMTAIRPLVNWNINKDKIISFEDVFINIKEENYNDHLPTKVVINETKKRTTMIFKDNRVVRTEAKGEFILEFGLVVGLLKGLNYTDYRDIIEYAYTGTEFTDDVLLFAYVYLLGVLHSRMNISKKQLRKLISHVKENKDNVNIGGHIIKLERK